MSGFTIGERFNPYKLYNGNFTPEHVSRFRGLSPGAKLVYSRLYRYSGEDGEMFPAIGTLAYETGLSESQVRRYIQELEKQRFVEVDRENHHYRKSGGGGSNRYFFLYHGAFNGEIGGKRKVQPLSKTKGVPLSKTEGVTPVVNDTPTPAVNDTLRELVQESHHPRESAQEGHARRSKNPKPTAEHGSETQDPKPNHFSLRVDDDEKQKPPESAENRLKAWANERGDPLSLVDWWAVKSAAEIRCLGLDELADLAEKNAGNWKSSAAGLKWLIKQSNLKATEAPQEVPPPKPVEKCPLCKCAKGQGTLIEDGCIKPCECATPEWLDKLAQSDALHAAAKAARDARASQAPSEGEAVA